MPSTIPLAVGCVLCSVIISIAPAIAALIVGIQYDGSLCDNSDYNLDLNTYLIVGGAVVLATILLSCIIGCCMFMFSIHLEDCNAEPLSMVLPFWLVTFNFIWACIGFHIYSSRMSDECQKEAIGQMIFAWSLIQIICAGPAYLLTCCAAIEYGCVEDNNNQHHF